MVVEVFWIIDLAKRTKKLVFQCSTRLLRSAYVHEEISPDNVPAEVSPWRSLPSATLYSECALGWYRNC